MIQDIELMNYIDVLVDGKFELEKRDITLLFRGSSNQRLINVPATRQTGSIVLYKGENCNGK